MKLHNMFALLLFSLFSFSPGFLKTGMLVSPMLATRPVTSGLVMSDDTLRVATMPIAPFIFQDGNELRGYSVDVWDQVARQLNLKYKWVVYNNIDELLQSIKENVADVAIAAISMTPDRDVYLDFTYPYFDSGLQIMVRQRPRLSFFQGFSLVTPTFLLEVTLMGLLAGLLMAHVIWLVERRSTPNFPRSYFQGIWEGLWWLMQIIASGSYHDLETKSIIKRLMTIIFWILGIAIVAEFTAALTSTLTVHQLTSAITDPTELAGYSIATVNHTTAADFLSQHEFDFVGVDQIEAAYGLLLDNKVDVIVFDAPVLLYYAAHQGNNKVAIPGKIFHMEKYGIALPIASPLRDDINAVLLQMYQDGTLEAMQNKWFTGP